MKPELQCSSNNPEPVSNSLRKIDHGSFRKIACRTGHFAQTEAVKNDLCEHLIIKDKVVRTCFDGQRFKNFAAECSKTCVVLGDSRIDHDVFSESKQAVCNKLIKRHTARPRTA